MNIIKQTKAKIQESIESVHLIHKTISATCAPENWITYASTEI